jgi:hypothetical protein
MTVVTILAVAAVAVACWLWVRMYRTPPDRSERRRLQAELERHRVELWEHEDPT